MQTSSPIRNQIQPVDSMAKPHAARLGLRAALLLILLVGAGLRLAGSQISPPGLSHDEVANWLIVQQIFAGQHAVYFTEAYGHEAGFHYLQAGTVVLLGDHALALRLPAMFAGILLISVTYILLRRLFGPAAALMAAALLAVLLWPIFFNRQGLRVNTLPVVSGLSAYFWWRAWQEGRWRWWGIAGILAGLSLYTYMAARAVPLFYALYLIYLLLFHRPHVKVRWRQVLLFWGLLALTALPLVLFLLRMPSAEFRISEIDAPLRALQAGDWRPVLANTLRFLGMFGFRGDPLWRQNVAGMPVFDPVMAALFYAGLGLAFWRWRDNRYAFVILWLLVGAVPSIVTIDAPSFIRISNSLPVVALFPALLMHSSSQLSTVFPQLSTVLGKNGLKMLLNSLWVLLILLHIDRSAEALFDTWPAQAEVQFVWQQALTDAGRAIDAAAVNGPVAIGGWSPDTMDLPTMQLSMRRRDIRLVYFYPQRTLIVPFSATGQPIRIVHPAILPLDAALAARLQAWGAPPQSPGSFTLYQLPALPAVQPQQPAAAEFGGQLRLLGYDWLPATPLDTLELVTYWQVLAPTAAPRRLFLHALTAAGEPVAQEDGLEAPAAYWQAGDLILFHHRLDVTGLPVDRLALGVYEPPLGPRLLLPDGRDSLLIPLPRP